MRDAVTVTLLKKWIANEYGYSGIVTDENIKVTFGYKNNTDKDISGVKGTARILDQFGEDTCAFNISNDDTIKAGETITWSGGRSVRFSINSDKDKKCASLEEGKYKVGWFPEQIVFADGSKIIAPTE